LNNYKFLFVISILIPFLFLAQVKADSRKYVEIEWQDLVPKDWEPPIILPAHEDHQHVDATSLVKSLSHKKIKLPGFMIPTKVEGQSVTEFVLVPFLEHHVNAHVHHDSNQMLYVFLESPLKIDNPFQPFWVEGEILLESVETKEGATGYTVKNARAEIYVY